MSALRLEVETHIVTASATAVQNLTKCVAAAGRQDRRARRRLARLGRGRPVRDREGARRRGRRHRRRARSTSPCSRTARRSTPRVLPVGGNNVTNDVAIGLKTSLQVAEELKIRHGTCGPARQIDDDEEISVSVLGEDAGRTVSRLEVCQIIEARMRETFELIGNEIRAAGRRHAAGRDRPDRRRVAARRAPPSSAARSSRCRSGSPRRRASAGSSTRCSRRLQHGRRAAPVGRDEPSRRASRMRYESAPAVAGSAGSATRSGASSRRRRASSTVRTGRGPRPRRPDRRLRRVRRRGDGGDGLLSIFVPACDRRARGRGDRGRLGRRPAGRARPAPAARRAAATGTATGRPAMAPTTSCRCSRRRR